MGATRVSGDPVTTFTYDDDGNLLREAVSDGDQTLERTMTYWPPAAFNPPNGGVIKNRMHTSTDRRGVTTSYSYDAAGNLIEQSMTNTDIDGTNQTISIGHSYFANGLRSSTTNPNGNTTGFRYDARGNLERVTTPEGNVTRTVYDQRSRLLESTDPNGNRNDFRYDDLDRLVRTELPAVGGSPGVRTTGYEDALNRKTDVDAEGRELLTEYDLEGRIVRMVNPTGAEKIYEYDAIGNKTLESSWFDDDTPRLDVVFRYDAAGRLIEREEPLGRLTSYVYDPVGNLLRQTLSDLGDPQFEPRVTEYEVDLLNRRTLTRRLGDEHSPTVRTEYDGEGNVTRTIDSLGRLTRNVYDQAGRLIETLDPAWRSGGDGPDPARTTRRLYDHAGNLLEERRLNQRLTAPLSAGGTWQANDQVRSFRHDSDNRVIRRTDAEGHATTLEYDAAANLIAETDPRLSRTEHEYDARNRRSRTTQLVSLVPGDQYPGSLTRLETTFEYDQVDNLTSTTTPNGNRARHTYDNLNRLTASVDSLGPVRAFTYDARGNRLTESDANGNVASHTFDDLDRLVQRDLPESRTEAFAYDAADNRVSQTDPRGNVTSFEYDRLDRLVRTLLPPVGTGMGGGGPPAQYEITATYDAAGNQLTQTDTRGNTTSTVYDALDRPVLRTDPAPLSYTTETVYDAQGNAVSIVDRRGIEQHFVFDRENRRLSQQRAGVLLEQISYDEVGNVEFRSDANGNTTSFVYDQRNLLLAENAPLAAVTVLARDAMGDPTYERDAEGRETTRVFDLRRRAVSETNGAGETAVSVYDLNGNRTELRRPKHSDAPWTYAYDDADRLTSVTDPLGHQTSFTFDASSNLLSQTDANGHVTAFSYDEHSRRRSRTLAQGTADEATESYSYDPAGNLIGNLDFKGQLSTFAYDELQREVERTFDLPTVPTGDDLTRIATVYDPNGNVTAVTESYTDTFAGDGSPGPTGDLLTQQTFDLFDRLIERVDAQGETLRYSYDANGNRTRLTDADGRVTRNSYDALNRVSSVAATAGVTQYAYFRDSRLARVTYPNGAEESSTYDDAGRVATIEHTLGQATVSSYAYSYDLNGNRATQTERNGGPEEVTGYLHDEADRLVEIAYPDQTVAYDYDPVGNRILEETSQPGGTVTARLASTFDARNRLLHIDDSLDPTALTTFSWDLNGNQTGRSRGGVTRTQFFDARDRLREISQEDPAGAGGGGPSGGDFLLTFRYDYRGLRTRKSGPDGVVRYVYDDRSVLHETDDAGNTLARYEYGPDRLLSLDHVTEGRGFYLLDALGSVSGLLDEGGALQARYQWDAWGERRGGSGESENRFGFTGHLLDDESGLYYARARYYDPEVGRFLSTDPFEGRAEDPPSLHAYLYGKVSPTVYVDPSGEVARGKELSARIRKGGAEAAAELSGEVQEIVEEKLGDGLLGKYVSNNAAAIIGIFGGSAEVVAGGVDLLNTSANVVIGAFAPESELGQEALEELVDTVEGAQDTLQVIREDPIGVGTAAVGAVVDTAQGVAQGDARAISRLTSFATEAVAGGAGVGAARTGARTAVRGTKEVTERVVSQTDEVVDAVQTANRRTRQKTAATEGRQGPSEPQPAAQTQTPDKPSAYCFVAGTLVWTADGMRPIEQVQVGDLVWSRTEADQEPRLQRVAQTFVTPDQQVWEVTVTAPDGSTEQLGTTDEHPFWVLGKGWVAASALLPGDQLASPQHPWLEVRQVRGSPRTETVYNFEVEEDHTYFVGELRTWVHNLCEKGRERLLHNLQASRDARQARATAQSAPPGVNREATGTLREISTGRFAPDPVRSLAGSSRDMSPSATTYRGGRLGTPETRAHVEMLALHLQDRGYTIEAGGGFFDEEFLPGPGPGTLGGNFVDLTASRNGRILRVNTVDTKSDGLTPTPRELDAAELIREKTPGDHLLLVPKPKRP